MPKESIITVFRSTTTDTPTGLTFGELAYSDLNGKLFVGKNDGNSLWVGASITSGTIGDNQYLVPTQSAVKSYVDGIVGGGSVVNSVNGSSGAVTITGDAGAISNVQVGGANTVRARLASTSLTGVASFNATRFTVSAAGAVDIASAYQVTGDTVSAVGSAIASRSNNSVTVDNRLASTSLTGVASFSSTNFDVSGAGAVSVKTGGITNGNLENSSVTVSAGTGLGGGGSVALGSSVTLTNLGVLSLNGLTGARTLTGDGGAIIGVGNNTIAARLASTSVTGAASFNATRFTVSAGGAVDIASAYQITGDTVVAGTGISVTPSGNSKTIANLGVLSFNGVTGAATLTGDGGAIVGVGNNTVRARLASTSVTGAASFSDTNFDVSAAGAVTVKTNGISNTNLANSSITVSTLPISLGGSLTITGTAGEVDVSASSSTITIGLPDNVTIAGNLTVNGTVVTTNVDNFVVEDPLIMLGTGNAADSIDLGFYARYDASAKYTGLFRDASDSGVYRLFTGLTVEPTTTVNTGGAGYTMATLIARIDGGTF